MTASKLGQEKTFRKLLESKRKECEKIITQFDQQQRVEQNEAATIFASINGSEHMAGEIDQCCIQGVASQIIKEKTNCLKKINQALDNLETGSYGICSICQEPIEYQRLRQLPFADLCLDCAKDQEREAKMQKATGTSFCPRRKQEYL